VLLGQRVWIWVTVPGGGGAPIVGLDVLDRWTSVAHDEVELAALVTLWARRPQLDGLGRRRRSVGGVGEEVEHPGQCQDPPAKQCRRSVILVVASVGQ
jgi:hypothetical protein